MQYMDIQIIYPVYIQVHKFQENYTTMYCKYASGILESSMRIFYLDISDID